MRGAHFFALAEKKHDRSLYEAAYLQFQQAYAIAPDDRTVWNLAVCEIRTDRFVEGLEHLRVYDAHQHVLAQTAHPYFAKFNELLQQGNAATGHLTIDAPVGAVVTVDGKNVTTHAPVVGPVDVPPGDHAVTAQLGDKTAKLVVNAAAGSTTDVHLAFAPDVPPPVPVATTTTPLSRPPTADDTPAVTATSSTRRVLALSALSVGVVGLGAGIGFGLAAKSKSSDLSTLQSSHPSGCADGGLDLCAQSQSLSDDSKRDSTISTIGFVVAGVGVVGAAAAWFLWPASSTRTAWIVPSVGAQGGELRFGGSF